MKRAAVLMVVLLAGGIVACKKPPLTYDQRTPEATLASFEKAVNARRIPADLRKLVGGPQELAAWQLRCETWGCAKAKLEIVEVGPRADYTALLYVDYQVLGEDGSRVIAGQRSPIELERVGDHWVITKFGRQTTPDRRPKAPSTAPDGGSASESS